MSKPAHPYSSAFIATFVLTLCLTACDSPTLFTIFTALSYMGDGEALIIEATDGIYLASPPDDTPKRLGDSKQGCEGSGEYSLGCARIAATRIALLRGMTRDASGIPTWNLWLFEKGSGGRTGKHVATNVIDAVFTPDGAEILWTKIGSDGHVSLFRLGENGEETLVLDAIELGEDDDMSGAISALIVTSAGVAHTRSGFSGLSLWFQPFGSHAPRELGGVASVCAGNNLSACYALSHDGVTFAWQESGSSILQIYRSNADLRLPLGSGSSFRFSRAGSLLLRFASRTAFVHRADTAAIVREVPLSNAAQLSADGEMLAHLALVSTGMQTSRLKVGPSRQNNADNDYGILTTPPISPLWASVAGSSALPFSFTGDGRFVVASTAGSSELTDQGLASLISVDVNTSEMRVLDELSCSQCCQVASSGALILCTPIDTSSTALQVALDVYDPATGLRTRGADKLLSYKVLRDGTAVVLTDYVDATPKLKVVTKTGQVISMGTAYQFDLSPTESQVAYVNQYGKLSIENLP